MAKKIRVTIGVPAYNEEANLRHLLRDFVLQKMEGFELLEVHVVSDASTDETEAVAREEKRLPIRLTVHQKRQGIAAGLNEILGQASGDIVVIVNADVWIKDPDFLSKLIAPIVAGRADLTSCNLVALDSETLLGNAVDASMRIKTKIFEAYKNADNVYCCHGTARAFSQDLAKKIRFPHSVGEDAYSYLFAKLHHYRFEYVFGTEVYYALPQHFTDHMRQSIRYESSRRLLLSQFGKDFLFRHYALPRAPLAKAILRALIHDPRNCLYYSLIQTAVKVCSLWAGKHEADTWEIAASSKQITRKKRPNRV